MTYSYRQFMDANGKTYWVVYLREQPVGRFKSMDEAKKFVDQRQATRGGD